MFRFTINRVDNWLILVPCNIVNQNGSVGETNSEQIRTCRAEIDGCDAVLKVEDALWVFQVSHRPDAHKTRTF